MATKSRRKRFTPEQTILAEEQIIEQRRTVDYDTHEYTVGFLVQEFEADHLYIPVYQRKFVWDQKRKSKFIESMILGLPIPLMFVSDTPGGTLEIVDGAQRIQTLQQFSNDELKLKGLRKLGKLNGFRFGDLPPSQQLKFRNRSFRMVKLSDKTDEPTRRDLFERINTGSDELTKSELRKGAHAGPFYALVQECASNGRFIELTQISERLRNRGEGEELVLRFFTYSDKYLEFQHDVSEFLHDYLRDKNERGFDEDQMRARFADMLHFVSVYFPYGFRKKDLKQTPRVRFEAISVGAHLALLERPDLVPQDVTTWLESDEFKQNTRTDASNSPFKLRGRIEFVRDALLGRATDA